LIMCEKINDDKWTAPDMKRVSGGLMADAVCVAASGLLGGMASDTSSSDVALTVPGYGLATAVDIGAVGNIHPPNKQEVGRRLAQVALKQVYGQKVAAGAPRYAGAQFEGGKAIVRFEQGSGPLVLKEKGSFEIAGADRKFVPANATLEGEVIEVIAPSVAQPVAVRYGFLNAPEMSLFDSEGWPVLPFRSDAWEIKHPE